MIFSRTLLTNDTGFLLTTQKPKSLYIASFMPCSVLNRGIECIQCLYVVYFIGCSTPVHVMSYVQCFHFHTDRKRNAFFSEPWELVQSLCPNPALKYITPMHAESSSCTWEQLFTKAGHQNTAATSRHTMSLAVVARGNEVSIKQFSDSTNSAEKRLKQMYRTVEWNPFPVDFRLSHEPHLGAQKMLTVLANSAHIVEHMESVLQRAGEMYREGAYLHWYERYGCGKETFEEAFETMREVVSEYSRLQ